MCIYLHLFFSSMSPRPLGSSSAPATLACVGLLATVVALLLAAADPASASPAAAAEGSRFARASPLRWGKRSVGGGGSEILRWGKRQPLRWGKRSVDEAQLAEEEEDEEDVPQTRLTRAAPLRCACSTMSILIATTSLSHYY